MDGVFFSEEPGERFRITESQVRVRINRQNSNLTQVKRQLAAKVRQAGGNALVGFTYGQKRTFLSWDEVAWQGAGYPANLSEVPAT